MSELYADSPKARAMAESFGAGAESLRQSHERATLGSVAAEITRDELDAKLAAVDARGETQFERLRGDIRELKASSVSKSTFFIGMVSAVAVIIAVLAYAGQWFGLGLQSSDVLTAAARKGAEQAIQSMQAQQYQRQGASPPPAAKPPT